MRKPCCENRETNKGAWSKQEDQKLIDYVQKHGEGCWHTLPKAAGLLRCGKSCRLRWVNYLKPDLKRGNFQEDEIELIIKLHGLLGNRWSLIAGRLPGRTDNEVKNYWNTHLRKKLSLMGTVPKHHHLHLSGGVAQCHNNTNNNIDSNNRSNNSNINQCENTASPERSPTPISTGTGTGIPDLNLDLTLSTPPPAAEEHRTHHACNRDIDTGTPATMLLLG